ncbi:ParB/RepB/Spo0J family partition protein [Acidiphilium iwatense]|uniref:ParB N-terminal domain-containing protein n=1 Tax=Acidiphilium iwatense TaxID=768198 RepID=A0ABS9DWW2_9PROT|nr:ParB/RepB/Spo0J family partition protein [Acidiphilium iwatense]MCF3947224.1 ParB N-terminal domain-containing protein [Acidiphilium iwatense]
MATAVQKITLSSSRDIPFNKLMLSQSNVRRVKAGVSIDSLAASIARRGLIQSLSVLPVIDAEGNETGMFEVPAGGRRFRALELLVKQKRLTKTAPVPCIVRDRDDAILAEEISYAENADREALHPLDQFRAFQDMRAKGMPEEDIAAAHFVPVQIVKQRLKLASVSPALLDVYAEDGMTLEQLMAFTVSDSHDRQEKVWEAARTLGRMQSWQIKGLLTEGAVRAADKRAVFVGIDDYEQAGGYVMRDLFEHDDGGWLQDPALLDTLVASKLKAVAEEVAAEGWKWVEVALTLPYGATRGLRELTGVALDMIDEEQVRAEALQAEYARLEAEYEDADELPDEIDQRLGEIKQALEAFDDRPVRYDPADIAIAGVFVSIDAGGGLVVDRGYVRPDDELPVEPEASEGSGADGITTEEPEAPDVQRAVITIGSQPVEADDEEDDAIKPLPERLVIELTAYRTLALRDAVAQHPHVAMTMLLHKLVTDTFLHGGTTGCLHANVRETFFPIQAEDLKDSVPAKTVTGRQEAWKQDIPADDDALWSWLDWLDDTSRMALLAHCVSYGVNALYERPNPYSGSGVSEHGLQVRFAQTDRLARATGLDMVAAGWRPTFGNYLNRVTKPRILEAVREGAGERAAQLIEHLKKGDMAREAERLLTDTGWLPEPLRLADLDAEQTGETSTEADAGDDAALPDFLTGDDEDAAADEGDAQTAIAVE